MTTEQKQLLADALATLTVEELPAMVEMIWQAFAASHTAGELDEIGSILLDAGVDVRPLCKRKHPA